MNYTQKFLIDTFGIDENTSATLIVTLAVFFLGISITEISKFIINYRKRRNYRHLFKLMLNEIGRSAKKQSHIFKKFYGTLSIDNDDHFVLTSTTITHLENVEKLNYEIIYASLFSDSIFKFRNRQLRLKAFNKMFAQIKLLKDIEYRYPLQLNDMMNSYQQYQNSWNHNINNFRRIADHIIHQTQGITANSLGFFLYIREFDGIYSTWQRHENRTNKKIIYEHLVQPMLLLNRNFANDENHAPKIELTQYNININVVIDNLLEVELSYENLCETLNVYSDIFKDYYFIYRFIPRSLDKCIQILY